MPTSLSSCHFSCNEPPKIKENVKQNVSILINLRDIAFAIIFIISICSVAFRAATEISGP